MAVFASVISVHPFGSHLRPGTGGAFVVLVAFFVAFLAIRTSARLSRSVSWWPGGVTAGDVHLHHLVWGICLMLLCGFLGFAVPLVAPWWHVVAIGFGVGAGLTLDEFALWIHLDDVYWAEQGRQSLDAVVCALTFAALVVLGTRPFGLSDPDSIVETVIVVAAVLVLACICFAKGRTVFGIVTLFIPIAGVVGAVRLARPNSLWARRRYGDEALERAHRRFAGTRPLERISRRLGNLIAGAPTSGGDDPTDSA